MRERIELLQGQVDALLVSVLRWPTENLMLIISFCRRTWRSHPGIISQSIFASSCLTAKPWRSFSSKKP
jgi:hypothetical protein